MKDQDGGVAPLHSPLRSCSTRKKHDHTQRPEVVNDADRTPFSAGRQLRRVGRFTAEQMSSTFHIDYNSSDRLVNAVLKTDRITFEKEAAKSITRRPGTSTSSSSVGSATSSRTADTVSSPTSLDGISRFSSSAETGSTASSTRTLVRKPKFDDLYGKFIDGNTQTPNPALFNQALPVSSLFPCIGLRPSQEDTQEEFQGGVYDSAQSSGQYDAGNDAQNDAHAESQGDSQHGDQNGGQGHGQDGARNGAHRDGQDNSPDDGQESTTENANGNEQEETQENGQESTQEESQTAPVVPDNHLYCICRRGSYPGEGPVVQCILCDGMFHLRCLGLEHMGDHYFDRTFRCANCAGGGREDGFGGFESGGMDF